MLLFVLHLAIPACLSLWSRVGVAMKRKNFVTGTAWLIGVCKSVFSRRHFVGILAAANNCSTPSSSYTDRLWTRIGSFTWTSTRWTCSSGRGMIGCQNRLAHASFGSCEAFRLRNLSLNAKLCASLWCIFCTFPHFRNEGFGWSSPASASSARRRETPVTCPAACRSRFGAERRSWIIRRCS